MFVTPNNNEDISYIGGRVSSEISARMSQKAIHPKMYEVSDHYIEVLHFHRFGNGISFKKLNFNDHIENSH